MATMTAAQKNEKIKELALNSMHLGNAIEFGSFAYAIPVEVDGEVRYAKVTITAASNKDTKTTKAFDPEAAREAYLVEKSEKEENAAKAAAERERKKAEKSKKSKKTEKTEDEEV